MNSLTGRRACQAIQYEYTAEPSFSWKCHWVLVNDVWKLDLTEVLMKG